MTEQRRRQRLPRLAMLPLEAFAPPDAWIIDDADMGFAEHAQLYVAAEQIGDAHAEFLRNPGSAKPLPFTQRADILFFMVGTVVLAVCAETGRLAGGVCDHIPIVFPAHRARGIGRDFHLMADENGLVLFHPEYFSRAGYGARLAAHRVAVLQAVRAGRYVHPENLERYRDQL
jgi:hypothetical protein